MRGAFQKVIFDGDDLKVNRHVKGFYFILSQLSDATSKIEFELIILRKDGKKLRLKYESLFPEWVLDRIYTDWTFKDAMQGVIDEEDDMIESLLSKAADSLEDLLVLAIGRERKDIYFTIRYAKQKVSILDEVIPEEEVEGFIEIIEED